MDTIKSLLKSATEQLKPSSETARLDAEIMLSHVLNKSRVYLIAHGEDVLSKKDTDLFQNHLIKRLQGEPIAHLVGLKEFWSLPFKVTSDTLIPRPETELLVTLALEQITNPHAAIIDLGTGTGAIALSLAHERPLWKILASDISLKALRVAKTNAQLLATHNVQFILSQWLNEIPQQSFDAIISNPPYISESDPHLAQGDVRFEPPSALVSGKEGLDDICQIIRTSHAYLKPRGLLLIEHGYHQKNQVQKQFKAQGYQSVQTFQDHQANDRVTIGMVKNKT